MGDFNAKVGTKTGSDTKVENFGFDKETREEGGERLVEFSEANKRFV